MPQTAGGALVSSNRPCFRCLPDQIPFSSWFHLSSFVSARSSSLRDGADPHGLQQHFLPPCFLCFALRHAGLCRCRVMFWTNRQIGEKLQANQSLGFRPASRGRARGDRMGDFWVGDSRGEGAWPASGRYCGDRWANWSGKPCRRGSAAPSTVDVHPSRVLIPGPDWVDWALPPLARLIDEEEWRPSPWVTRVTSHVWKQSFRSFQKNPA